MLFGVLRRVKSGSLDICGVIRTLVVALTISVTLSTNNPSVSALPSIGARNNSNPSSHSLVPWGFKPHQVFIRHQYFQFEEDKRRKLQQREQVAYLSLLRRLLLLVQGIESNPGPPQRSRQDAGDVLTIAQICNILSARRKAQTVESNRNNFYTLKPDDYTGLRGPTRSSYKKKASVILAGWRDKGEMKPLEASYLNELVPQETIATLRLTKIIADTIEKSKEKPMPTASSVLEHPRSQAAFENSWTSDATSAVDTSDLEFSDCGPSHPAHAISSSGTESELSANERENESARGDASHNVHAISDSGSDNEVEDNVSAENESDWVDVDRESASVSMSDIELDSKTVMLLRGSQRHVKNLSFVRILQHYHVAGKISLKATTQFLQLLWLFKPYIDYNELPKSARTLVRIKNTGNIRMLKDDDGNPAGKYVHFNLRDALLGNSPGRKSGRYHYLVFKNFV